MRWTEFGLGLSMLASACSERTTQDPVPMPDPVPTVSPPVEYGPSPSLLLHAALVTAGPVEIGTYPKFTARLTNAGSTPAPVVQLGEGSDMSFSREPFVFYTIERLLADGTWRSIETLQGASRACVADSDWSDEVTALPPGAGLELELDHAPVRFIFEGPGQHRARVHYRFQRDRRTASGMVIPSAMAVTPQHEVVSNPVAFEMVRPYDVRLRFLKPMKAGVAASVEDVVQVVLTNLTTSPRDLRAGKGASLLFEIDGAPGPSLPRVTPTSVVKSVPPRHKVVVLGPGSIEPIEPPSLWTVPDPGTYRVRVRYFGVLSNWAELVVK